MAFFQHPVNVNIGNRLPVIRLWERREYVCVGLASA